ncbi:MAG TPA: hypothetical protein VGS20_02465 [Candidatus Acidoferrales bacterium]|nr:hypothetical protein [Candidatus Acidoferrales bacterium]
MADSGVKVLLLSSNPDNSLALRFYLEERGCQCWHARTTEQALELFHLHGFHLILSAHPVPQTDPLLDRLGGSDCTMFYRMAVEDGSWWLPFVLHGRNCLGAPALHPNQFLEVLDLAVREAVPDLAILGGA